MLQLLTSLHHPHNGGLYPGQGVKGQRSCVCVCVWVLGLTVAGEERRKRIWILIMAVVVNLLSGLLPLWVRLSPGDDWQELHPHQPRRVALVHRKPLILTCSTVHSSQHTLITAHTHHSTHSSQMHSSQHALLTACTPHSTHSSQHTLLTACTHHSTHSSQHTLLTACTHHSMQPSLKSWELPSEREVQSSTRVCCLPRERLCSTRTSCSLGMPVSSRSSCGNQTLGESAQQGLCVVTLTVKVSLLLKIMSTHIWWVVIWKMCFFFSPACRHSRGPQQQERGD